MENKKSMKNYMLEIIFNLGIHLILFAVCIVPVKAQSSDNRSTNDKVTGSAEKPNIILILADDLGWGDTGFNGNDMIQTPNLDDMADNGLVFNRFYVASPICSPSRGSFLTGRHPYRYGIFAAHTAGMRIGEVTIAEALKENGYTTGFFGKWHLGWVKPNQGGSRGYYSPPWHHGFDVNFATKSAVPLWNPTVTPEGWNKWGQHAGKPWKGGTPYVRHNQNTKGWGQPVTKNMEGDDSRVIMDRVIPFIREQAQKEQPFLSLVWFHTPHEPVVAGPKYRALYDNLGSEKKKNYYGAITAMDQQIGRLREELRRLGVAENTIVFFASDNGTADPIKRSGVGSTGPFRGHKHTMYEGGVRVPAIAEWPDHIAPGRTDAMASSMDFMPTVLDLNGIKSPASLKDRPIDGLSLKPLLFGNRTWKRPKPVEAGWMRLYKNENGLALISNRYKLIKPTESDTYELYDLLNDPSERNNIAGEHLDIVNKMKQILQKWLHSTRRSRDGADYKY